MCCNTGFVNHRGSKRRKVKYSNLLNRKKIYNSIFIESFSAPCTFCVFCIKVLPFVAEVESMGLKDCVMRVGFSML